MKTVIMSLVLIADAAFCHAMEDARQFNYYDDPDVCKGWFCYEDPNQDANISTIHPGQQFNGTKKAYSGEVDWARVQTMPPEELKQLINDSFSYAQQDPSDKKRLLDYMKLQGVAMRRAKQFQETWVEVVSQNPVLDETVKRSPTQAGTFLEVVAERGDRNRVIAEMAQNMGLIYFYSPTCPYCEKEKEILNAFVEKWQWKNITAINIVENPRSAQEYGVQTIPDLWVVGNVNGEVNQRRLKAGLATHSDIERGLLMAWKMWFQQKPYERPQMGQELMTFDEYLKKE